VAIDVDSSGALDFVEISVLFLCCSVLWRVAVWPNVDVDISRARDLVEISAPLLCCSVLQWVAVCCSVLQCVAVCCSVWCTSI